MPSTIDRIANRLTQEDGYRETPVNLTRYAVALDILEHPPLPRQGSPWCGTFIDWGFRCEGMLAALPTANFFTPAAAQKYYALGRWSRTPRRGALGFLHRLGDHGHVGFVLEALPNDMVRTVEGNTTTFATGSQANGGEVAIKVRPVSFWEGFGLPFYERLDTPINSVVPEGALMAMTALGSACHRQPADHPLWPGRMQHYRAVINQDGTVTVLGVNGATIAHPTGEPAFGMAQYTIPHQPTEFLGLVGLVPDHGGVGATFGQGIWIDVVA